MVDWAEFRAGLAETRQYLLSHHEPEDHYRTYVVGLLGRRVRLCARCTGVYPGILAGGLGVGALASLYWILLLPLPALVDWTWTRFTDDRGYNALRTATGLGLGYAYGLGARELLAGDLRVLLIGGVYAVAAGSLLVLRGRHRR